jgi:hypothetical protein
MIKISDHFGEMISMPIFPFRPIPNNIIDQGLEQFSYFTEQYIDYIIYTKNINHFITLSNWDIVNLFNNAGKNRTKLIEYVITNINNVDKKFIRSATLCHPFMKRLIDLMFYRNKFMLELDVWGIQNLWYYVSMKSWTFLCMPSKLQVNLEDLIYKDIEFFNDEQLRTLCSYWTNGFIILDCRCVDYRFIKKCIEKLEKINKEKADICKKYIRPNTSNPVLLFRINYFLHRMFNLL